MAPPPRHPLSSRVLVYVGVPGYGKQFPGTVVAVKAVRRPIDHRGGIGGRGEQHDR